MGIGDYFQRATREICIQRPDQFKELVLYKHPDETIPMFAQCTVDSDEGAVFFKDGKVMGILGPGRHTLDGATIPFLSELIDKFTGGNVLICEVYFVRRNPVRDLPFGGRLPGIRCPITGIKANLQVNGTYVAQIQDPRVFITEYAGQRGQANSNEQIFASIRDELVNELPGLFYEELKKKEEPLNEIMAVHRDLVKRLETGVPALDRLGVRIVDIIRLNVKIPPEQDKKIEERYQLRNEKKYDMMAQAEADAAVKQVADVQNFGMDAQYANLAGQNPGYMARAQADALRDAGRGMAEGGGGGSNIAGLGAQMAVGVGMAGMFQQGFYQPAPMAAQPVQGAVQCSKCGHGNANGGKFCANCGGPLAAPPPAGKSAFCTNCGSAVSGKFCGNCGTTAPQPGQAAMPQPGAPMAPQQGYPPAQQAGAPQQGYPPAQQAGAPQQGYPPAQQPGAPQQGYPPAQQAQGQYAGGAPQQAPRAAPPQQAPPAAAPQQAPPGAPPAGSEPQGGGGQPQG